jgi:outer membrane protein assembly factor BamB
MDAIRLWFVAFGAWLILSSSALIAKRVPPAPVTPVIFSGVRYSAAGDGVDEYVVASDAADGHELWRVRVAHNRINPWKEEDNQWVFISKLKVENGSVLVRDEKRRCFSVDLATHQTRKVRCSF